MNVLIPKPEQITNGSQTAYRGIDLKLLGGGFQGDMLFHENYNVTKNVRGVAVYGDNYRWPYNTIPYDISAITDIHDQKMVTNAMHILMYDVGTPISGSEGRVPCVYFRPRGANDQAYLKIQYGTGCSAHVGYVSHRQSEIYLQKDGCFETGVIQHELMHILSFHHEQCRPDRDNYVQVNWENIENGKQYSFEKYTWGSSVYNQGTTYDYASIMHYFGNAFSKNGKPTMVPLKAGVVLHGARVLSPTDIFEVRQLYNCNA
ncbi:unnamed protein product [Adineta ricciae]|uniref:Metalloendopeptidase n=1 Tax=Adineta ricciae TaxID=249248 RepID=A0A814DY54_ADIRI|nr:unnamed protein product [Adineta ricciae]